MSKSILVVLLIVIFYVAFIVYSDFEDFVQSISQFKLEYLLPVFGLYFVGMLITGIRQQFLFKTSGILIPFKKSILLYLAGHSMEISPGGSGKLIKSYYLKKKFGYSISKSFPIIFVERFYDLLALTTIISLTLFFMHIIEVAIIVFIVIGMLVMIYVIINSKTSFGFIVKIFSKIPFLKKFVISLNESQEVFQSLTTKKNFVKHWFLSVIAYTLYAIGAYFVFLGFNVNVDIIFTTFVTFSSTLFGVISLLPGGIGVTEVSIVGFLINEGITLSLATSIMVMLRLAGLLFITIIGFITTKLFLK